MNSEEVSDNFIYYLLLLYLLFIILSYQFVCCKTFADFPLYSILIAMQYVICLNDWQVSLEHAPHPVWRKGSDVSFHV